MNSFVLYLFIVSQESIAHVVYSIITEISPRLSFDHICHLYERIYSSTSMNNKDTVPSFPKAAASVIDVQFVRMIRTFTLNALEVLSNAKEPTQRLSAGPLLDMYNTLFI
jgi:hypothetical protein